MLCVFAKASPFGQWRSWACQDGCSCAADGGPPHWSASHLQAGQTQMGWCTEPQAGTPKCGREGWAGGWCWSPSQMIGWRGRFQPPTLNMGNGQEKAAMRKVKLQISDFIFIIYTRNIFWPAEGLLMRAVQLVECKMGIVSVLLSCRATPFFTV